MSKKLSKKTNKLILQKGKNMDKFIKYVNHILLIIYLIITIFYVLQKTPVTNSWVIVGVIATGNHIISELKH